MYLYLIEKIKKNKKPLLSSNKLIASGCPREMGVGCHSLWTDWVLPVLRRLQTFSGWTAQV